MSDIFTKEESLTYNGFKIAKLESIAKRSESEQIEFSYAVIKKSGKVLAKFDSFRYGLMNATGIGLFPLLGGKTKQLIISQTVPRGGRHWVVDLTANDQLSVSATPLPTVFFRYDKKEKEGWEFFDKAYTLPDADKIKAKVKEVLRKAPAYNFIRKRSST